MPFYSIEKKKVGEILVQYSVDSITCHVYLPAQVNGVWLYLAS